MNINSNCFKIIISKIWDKYIKISKIVIRRYSMIYKGEVKNTGKYVSIKEIDKEKMK